MHAGATNEPPPIAAGLDEDERQDFGRVQEDQTSAGYAGTLVG